MSPDVFGRFLAKVDTRLPRHTPEARLDSSGEGKEHEAFYWPRRNNAVIVEAYARTGADMEQVEAEDILSRIVYTAVDDKGVFIDYRPAGTEIADYRYTDKGELVGMLRWENTGIIRFYKIGFDRKSVVPIRAFSVIDCD